MELFADLDAANGMRMAEVFRVTVLVVLPFIPKCAGVFARQGGSQARPWDVCVHGQLLQLELREAVCATVGKKTQGTKRVLLHWSVGVFDCESGAGVS